MPVIDKKLAAMRPPAGSHSGGPDGDKKTQGSPVSKRAVASADSLVCGPGSQPADVVSMFTAADKMGRVDRGQFPKKLGDAGTLKTKALEKLDAVGEELAPGVFLLDFTEYRTMTDAFLRFQEHYESPEYAGKIFTRKQFEKWYAAEHGGKFTYYDDWGGHNIPSYVLDAFREGRMNPLSKREAQLVDATKGLHGKFYLIGAVESDYVGHELAHGLYYTNPEYRAKVLEILQPLDLVPLFGVLEAEGYTRSVFLDEVHAYLCDGGDEFNDSGVDMKPYRKAIRALQKLFAECAAQADGVAADVAA